MPVSGASSGRLDAQRVWQYRPKQEAASYSGCMSASPVDMELRAEFNELATVWKRETILMSSTLQIVEHWAYQRIIDMGEPAVPLILERLHDKGPDHWFFALATITGEEAAIGEDTMQGAAESWISWGHKRGII